MKPVVFLDLDGVIVDLLTPWFALYNDLYGADYDPLKLPSYDLDDVFGNEMVDLLGYPGLHYGAKPYRGAQSAVYELMGLCDLFIVSAVPRNRNALWEKHEWITKELSRFPLEKFIITKHKYLLSGSVMIDDYEGYLKYFVGIKLLIDAPWNCNVSGNGMVRIGKYPESLLTGLDKIKEVIGR